MHHRGKHSSWWKSQLTEVGYSQIVISMRHHCAQEFWAAVKKPQVQEKGGEGRGRLLFGGGVGFWCWVVGFFHQREKNCFPRSKIDQIQRVNKISGFIKCKLEREICNCMKLGNLNSKDKHFFFSFCTRRKIDHSMAVIAQGGPQNGERVQHWVSTAPSNANNKNLIYLNVKMSALKVTMLQSFTDAYRVPKYAFEILQNLSLPKYELLNQIIFDTLDLKEENGKNGDTKKWSLNTFVLLSQY